MAAFASTGDFDHLNTEDITMKDPFTRHICQLEDQIEALPAFMSASDHGPGFEAIFESYLTLDANASHRVTMREVWRIFWNGPKPVRRKLEYAEIRVCWMLKDGEPVQKEITVLPRAQ